MGLVFYSEESNGREEMDQKFWERRGDLGGCFLVEMEGVLKNFVKICVQL